MPSIARSAASAREITHGTLTDLHTTRWIQGSGSSVFDTRTSCARPSRTRPLHAGTHALQEPRSHTSRAASSIRAHRRRAPTMPSGAGVAHEQRRHRRELARPLRAGARGARAGARSLERTHDHTIRGSPASTPRSPRTRRAPLTAGAACRRRRSNATCTAGGPRSASTPSKRGGPSTTQSRRWRRRSLASRGSRGRAEAPEQLGQLNAHGARILELEKMSKQCPIFDQNSWNKSGQSLTNLINLRPWMSASAFSSWGRASGA